MPKVMLYQALESIVEGSPIARVVTVLRAMIDLETLRPHDPPRQPILWKHSLSLDVANAPTLPKATHLLFSNKFASVPIPMEPTRDDQL
jgi:hypothetical protein